MLPVTYRNLATRATVTRPSDTTAYSVGDVITGSTPAVIQFAPFQARTSGYITRVFLTTNRSAQIESLRLHLFSGIPDTLQADNAALNIPTSAQGNYLGYVDFTAFIIPGGAGFAFSEGSLLNRPFQVTTVNNALYGLLEARVGFTPASDQTFTITIQTEQST